MRLFKFSDISDPAMLLEYAATLARESFSKIMSVVRVLSIREALRDSESNKMTSGLKKPIV